MTSKFTLQVGVFTICTLFVLDALWAQRDQKIDWKDKLAEYKIKLSAAGQFWATYTMVHEVYDQSDGRYEKAHNRIVTELHRSRWTLSGQPYELLKFNFTASLDFVGRDLLSGTVGAANNGVWPRIRAWNVYAQWRFFRRQDFLHLTIGFFPVQFGRESMTPALRVTSMEKSWSQNYIRRHLVGIGPGRASGINLGGLVRPENGSIAWSYNVGLYSPPYHSFLGNSVGILSSPLLSGRLALHMGDPEFEAYTLNRRINYFNERHGITLAFASAFQGETEIFTSNLAIGADLLLNYGPLNLDGEFILMQRERNTLDAQSQTGHVRLSYNFENRHGHFVEPVLKWTYFTGALDSDAQQMAERLNTFAGTDYAYSINCNYYFNPDLKLTLNYTWRDADDGDAPSGATFNNYFSQNGVGAIRRGNWAGIGLVMIM